MLRIHFTVADAMNVRVVVLGALAEMQHSFVTLRRRGRHTLFDAWQTRTAADARSLPPDVGEVARFLAPPAFAMTDLFTLIGTAGEYAEGIDRLCEVPPGPLREELTYAPQAAGIHTPWMIDFSEGNRAARTRVTRALDAYHEVAIAPYWPRMRAVLENECATRLRVLTRQGLGAMLAGLEPTLRWSSPVLEVPGFRVSHPRTDLDLHLQGRGLWLAPSLFTSDAPGLYMPWDDRPAILIYQVPLNPEVALRLWRVDGDPGDRALAALLGSTRAAALRVVTVDCTTTELARRLNISPGSASHHATVLREAGLIVSNRHRNTVRHSITRLGAELLDTA